MGIAISKSMSLKSTIADSTGTEPLKLNKKAAKKGDKT